MKIIREGNLEAAIKKREQIVQFVCSDCGCIWEANNKEYKNTSGGRNDTYAVCRCPTCGHEEYVEH